MMMMMMMTIVHLFFVGDVKLLSVCFDTGHNGLVAVSNFVFYP